MPITQDVRTRAALRVRALIKAGDSEATSTSMWTTNEANYALTASYRQIMLRLLRKRHFCTSILSYFNTNASNPVATFSTEIHSIADIKSVHLSPDGVDLSGADDTNMVILKPRDWSFMEERIWGAVTINTPAFYTLVGDANQDEVELWVDLPPTTAGTSSIRMFHYGIPIWDESEELDEPVFPHHFDQLLINMTAINLRVDKDMDIADLDRITSEMHTELFKQAWSPKPENDYSIPVQGRISGRRNFFSGVSGWTKRGS